LSSEVNSENSSLTRWANKLERLSLLNFSAGTLDKNRPEPSLYQLKILG
jgi:hypothetical protein